jgi:LCP family protein required for cell wall assembly
MAHFRQRTPPGRLRRLWGELQRRLSDPAMVRLRTRGWQFVRRHGLPALGILLLIFASAPGELLPPGSAPGLPGGADRRGEPGSAVPHGDERFLIVGLTQDQHRTDTIMVAQWDAARHQARVLGIPRDIGVIIPRIGFTKLVHAYSTGGVGRTRVATAKLLGVPIAHYFVFSIPALRHLVDLIGGVPLVVEKRMVYHDREQGLFINLQAGPQILDGAHAEQYVRFRNDPDGDIGRIRRQQYFLRAALQAVHRPAVWVRLPQIIGAARAELGTDLTSEQLLGWVHEIDHLTPDAVSAQTIEGRPATLFDSVMGMQLSFWQPDMDDLRAKVRWLLTGELPPPPKP